jgi:hypothetical protein
MAGKVLGRITITITRDHLYNSIEELEEDHNNLNKDDNDLGLLDSILDEPDDYNINVKVEKADEITWLNYVKDANVSENLGKIERTGV